MDLKRLGARVEAARLSRRWGKEQAAREAGISSITWKRVEDGKRVQSHKLYAVLSTLDLNAEGDPIGPVRTDPGFIALVESAAISERLRRDILARIAAERILEESNGPLV